MRASVAGGPNQMIQVSYQRVGIDANPIDGAVTLIPNGTVCRGTVFSELWSGLDWPASDIDSLEIGLRHTSGGGVQISQLHVVVWHH